jgi:hypothetical protein
VQRKSPPNYELTRQAIPALVKVLNTATDTELLADTCWAIAQLTNGAHERIQAKLDSGVTSRLIGLANHDFPAVQLPALRCCGNIVSNTHEQKQFVINSGLLGVTHAAESAE